MDAIRDLARSGERFGKDGFSVADHIGHTVQVARRQREEFRQCTIAIDDAKRRAVGTVGHVAAQTRGAGTVVRVDLADDACSLHFTFYDHADELVSQHTSIAQIASRDFDIGVADARTQDTDERFAVRRVRHGIIAFELELAIKDEGVQGWCLSFFKQNFSRLTARATSKLARTKNDLKELN